MFTPTVQITNRRYVLHDELGKGGMGVVYRATDRLTGQMVALKQVTTPTAALEFASRMDGDSFSMRLALAREFKIMASLRHPNIISVLDYGFDDAQQPYFTMNLLEDGQTFLQATRDQPFDQQIDFLVQILHALTYLHRRGILHRDLKPGNILVTGGQVQVLDFGLAAQRGIQSEVVGTLNYMAPEVLYDQPVSEASDLYALGIIAYEVFAGTHPFSDAQTGGNLIGHILNVMPDTSLLPVSPSLQNVITRLVQKEPKDRYASADDVIAAISEALEDGQVVYETAATRESFLQAAEFVGRGDEFETLNKALSRTLEGQGSAWLVSGESGVGKSRLLDELRTQALVGRVLVLRGQAISEGGASYQLWRPVLRYLCLTTTLSDLEASVLKALIPDIETLVEHPVVDAPDLDPQSTVKRFLNTVENILMRQNQSLLILLEDLHWAGQDSLLLLRHLSGVTQQPGRAGAGFMLVGNYRDDERPTLRTELPNMKFIKLSRLSEADIVQLSQSMLGEVGTRPGVLELLQRETEGNIFFIIEVVRALAEKAGQLRNIGDQPLPESVFTGGVRAVLQRRLASLPREATPMLQLAAVAGRQLDLNVLRVVYPQLNRWLTDASDAAVLDVVENRWQFAHDKLREAILGDLSPDSQRELHRKIAVATEQAYPQAREQAALLAYHWHAAGDLNREAHYLTIVGEQSLELGANQEAIKALSRALELRQAADSYERAYLTRKLADAHVGLGDMVNATDQYKQALALLAEPYPQQATVALVAQLVNQISHRVRMPHKITNPQEINRRTELVHIYGQLAELAFHINDTIGAVYGSVRGLNVCESLPLSTDRAVIYASMCITAGFIPLHRLARSYMQNATQTLEQLPPHNQAKAEVYVRLSLYALGICDWKMFDTTAPECRQLCEQTGDTRRWGEITNLMAHAAFDQGDVTESTRLFQELYETALKNKNAVHQGWALANLAMCLIASGGALNEALELLNQALALTEQTQNYLTTMNCIGLKVVAYRQLGDLEQARAQADKLLVMTESDPTSPTNFEGYVELPAVYLDLWKAGDAACAPQAKKAVKNLGRFARLFHNGKPRLALYQGMIAQLEGKQEQAGAAFKKALETAQQQHMPGEEKIIREVMR